MDLSTISQRLRDIRADDSDAANRSCERLLSRAARSMEQLWPQIQNGLNITADFPRPIESPDTAGQENVRLWNLTWQTLCNWIAPRVDLHDAADNQARLIETDRPAEGITFSVSKLVAADWQARATAAADLLDRLASLIEDKGVAPQNQSQQVQQQKIIVPTNEDVARVANLVAEGMAALTAAKKVAETSVHPAGSLRTMYNRWKRTTQK